MIELRFAGGALAFAAVAVLGALKAHAQDSLAQVVPTPTGNPATWATESDYPAAALRDRKEGVVQFRLQIGPDGLVKDCAVVQSSGSKELDDQTCLIVSQRARFSPARDTKGQAVGGTYTNRVRWVIPRDGEAENGGAILPGSELLSFIVETDGRVTNCQQLRNGLAVLPTDKRSICKPGMHFRPIPGLDGKPVRRKVTYSSSVTVTDPDARPAPKRRRGR